MENPPERWACCLNPGDATFWRATSQALAVSLYIGIPLATWDAIWFASGVDTPLRRQLMLSLYHLEIVTIDVEGVDVEVVRAPAYAIPIWVANEVFILSPAGACLDGCGLSKLPWQS